MTANQIIKTMQEWIGTDKRKIIDLYNSHKPLAHNYVVKYTDAWCDTTVSACFIKNNAVSLIGGTECGVERHIQLFKKAGIWIEDGTITPEPGDIITYNWDDSTQPNDGYADHIGIVEKVDGGMITVIEGNYNNAVKRRTISVGWGYIRGYARPKYNKEEKQEETKMSDKPVIDVSYHNGTIDWTKAKDAIAGAVIRCGFGSDFEVQDDTKWNEYTRECERLNIPYATYLYSYATSNAMARSEAKHALRLVKGHKPSVIYFDSEAKGTERVARETANTFIAAIRAAGYKAGLYSYRSWYNSYLKGIDCDSLWIAQYGTNNGKPQTKPDVAGMDMWQYTSVGKIPGSNHNTDLNIMYKNIFGESGGGTSELPLLELVARTQEGRYGNGDERVKNLGRRYGDVQTMINHIYRASAKELARDVIAGMFGNGDLRKRVLGSRYDEVQAEVNKMLK